MIRRPPDRWLLTVVPCFNDRQEIEPIRRSACADVSLQARDFQRLVCEVRRYRAPDAILLAGS
jgi:hypothetical protein